MDKFVTKMNSVAMKTHSNIVNNKFDALSMANSALEDKYEKCESRVDRCISLLEGYKEDYSDLVHQMKGRSKKGK